MQSEFMQFLCQLKISYTVLNAALPRSLGLDHALESKSFYRSYRHHRQSNILRKKQISSMTCLGSRDFMSKFCISRSSRERKEVSSQISINPISEMRALYGGMGKRFSHTAAKVCRRKHEVNCNGGGTGPRQQGKVSSCLHIYLIVYAYLYI